MSNVFGSFFTNRRVQIDLNEGARTLCGLNLKSCLHADNMWCMVWLSFSRQLQPKVLP
jgi:hypothetical protein